MNRETGLAKAELLLCLIIYVSCLKLRVCTCSILCAPKSIKCSSSSEGRGRDRMVVGLTTTCASSAYHH
jgi:hypothetical protein